MYESQSVDGQDQYMEDAPEGWVDEEDDRVFVHDLRDWESRWVHSECTVVFKVN